VKGDACFPIVAVGDFFGEHLGFLPWWWFCWQVYLGAIGAPARIDSIAFVVVGTGHTPIHDRRRLTIAPVPAW